MAPDEFRIEHGSTLRYTPETIQRLREQHALDAAPHLSCMGGTRRSSQGDISETASVGSPPNSS